MSFEYDAFNRLISASGTGPDGQTFSASYGYDALGRRVQKVVNGTETDFVYDGQQVIEERDDEADLLRQYVWGQYVDELVQQREYEQPPFGGPYGDLYPLGDLLYRSWALTHDRECGSGSSGGPGGGGGGQGSSSGSCSPNTPFVEVYDMDAYGRTRIYNGRGPDCQWFTDDDVQTYTPLCRYIFAGREYDPETGMYYNRARYYHPDLGRFISRDPLLFGGRDSNLYAYAHGNPLTATDPLGLTADPTWKGDASFPGEGRVGVVSHAKAMQDEAWNRAMWFKSHIRREMSLKERYKYQSGLDYWEHQSQSRDAYIKEHTPHVDSVGKFVNRWLGEEPDFGGRIVPFLGSFRAALLRWDEAIYGHGYGAGGVGPRIWSGIRGTVDVVMIPFEVAGVSAFVRGLGRTFKRAAAEEGVGMLTRVRRFFYDPRPWKKVSREYWEWHGPARARGLSLHHWLFPRRAAWIPLGVRNARFNLLEMPPIVRTPFGGLNEWMGMSRSPLAPVIEWAIKVGIPAALGGSIYVGARIGIEDANE